MSTFTTLYLTTLAPLYTPATVRGAWDDTAGAVVKALDTTKEGGGTITSVARAEANVAAEYDVLLARFIGPPCAAQTITGTVNVLLGILESLAEADFNWHLHIYFTQGDSDTPRGTVLDNYREAAGTNEWPTTAAGAALNAAATLSDLAISAGDRLVIEIGYAARNTVATSYTGTLYYGTQYNSATAPDLTLGSTAVTSSAGSITFSNAITTDLATRITQVTVDVASYSATPPVRVTQASVDIASYMATPPAPRVAQLSIDVATMGTPPHAGPVFDQYFRRMRSG